MAAVKRLAGPGEGPAPIGQAEEGTPCAARLARPGSSPASLPSTRIPAAGPLTPRAVAASSACIGLLRWDAGAYSVQPLVVATTERKRAVPVHAGGWAGGAADKNGAKAEQAAADAIAVLRERAGRLLRK